MFHTADRVDSSPLVRDGLTFVGSNDKNVYTMRAASGNLVASAATGGPVLSSPSVNGDGIVIGSNDGVLYDLEAPKG